MSNMSNPVRTWNYAARLLDSVGRPSEGLTASLEVGRDAWDALDEREIRGVPVAALDELTGTGRVRLVVEQP